MHSNSHNTDFAKTGSPQFQQAVDCLNQILTEGVRHGYFRCVISSEIRKEKKRELVIEAGKSYKFTIPEEELPR